MKQSGYRFGTSRAHYIERSARVYRIDRLIEAILIELFKRVSYFINIRLHNHLGNVASTDFVFCNLDSLIWRHLGAQKSNYSLLKLFISLVLKIFCESYNSRFGNVAVSA